MITNDEKRWRFFGRKIKLLTIGSKLIGDCPDLRWQVSAVSHDISYGTPWCQMEDDFCLPNDAKALARCSGLLSAPALVSSVDNQSTLFVLTVASTHLQIDAFSEYSEIILKEGALRLCEHLSIELCCPRETS